MFYFLESRVGREINNFRQFSFFLYLNPVTHHSEVLGMERAKQCLSGERFPCRTKLLLLEELEVVCLLKSLCCLV